MDMKEFSEYDYMVADIYSEKYKYVLEDLGFYSRDPVVEYIQDKLLSKDYSVKLGWTLNEPPWGKMRIYIRYELQPKKIPNKIIEELYNKAILIYPDDKIYLCNKEVYLYVDELKNDFKNVS